MSKAKKPGDNVIAVNKKARFEYHLDETFEAGIALQGWEVKSLRAGRVQLTDSYVLLKEGEAWLLGARINPLPSASTHYVTEPDRTRRLLLHRRELNKMIGATQQKGYTCVATKIYWKGHLVKVQVALARGKQKHDKRETIKDREWNIQKQRMLRQNSK